MYLSLSFLPGILYFIGGGVIEIMSLRQLPHDIAQTVPIFSITVVFNDVLTGSGLLVFGSPHLLSTQNCSKRLPFGSALLNLGFLSCNRSTAGTARLQEEK